MKRILIKLPLLALAFGFLAGAKQCDSSNSEPTDCICAAILDPVCASDGRTYGNACEAACEGETVVTNDECSFTLDGVGDSCDADDDCGEGQSCLAYVAFTGQTIASCHVDCDVPGEGSAICPAALTCVSVADGPGSVCADLD